MNPAQVFRSLILWLALLGCVFVPMYALIHLGEEPTKYAPMTILPLIVYVEIAIRLRGQKKRD